MKFKAYKNTIKSCSSLFLGLLSMSMAAPDDVIDFTHWKLQYGAYSSGGDDSEKTSSQLKNGWSDSDYF